MFRTLSPLRSAALFYLLTVGGVTVAALTGAGTAVAMVTPALGTVLMLMVFTREGWTRRGWAALGLHRPGLRFWPIAVAVPLAIVALGVVTVIVSGGAQWATSGNAVVSPWLWPLLILVQIVVASATVSLTEEVGWRGFLLPRLEALGVRKALLLSGLLHGIWHLPFILLTDLYHPAGSRFLVVSLFLILVTAVGVFLGWLRLRSGSVWPAVIAHSANNIGLMWMGHLIVGDPVAIQYLADEGAVAAVVYGAIAMLLLRPHQPRRRWMVRGQQSTRLLPASARPAPHRW